MKKALKYAEKELGIMRVEDWSTVSAAQLKKLGLSGLLWKYRGVGNLLETFFPGISYFL